MSTLSYRLYETDVSRYVGPHRWQISAPARMLRRALRQRAYTQWATASFTEVDVQGTNYLDALQGPAVFVGNHQSHLDTIAVHSAMPERLRSRLYFGAAQDRWYVKGKKKLELKPWYQSLALGNFPIMRGGGRNALAYAQWLLEKQQSVFLFPEGTRAQNGRLGEFKHGAVLLAREAGVPIVPLYLSGLREIRPKGSREVVPGRVGVEVLEPLSAADNCNQPVNRVTAALRDRMEVAHRAAQPLIAAAHRMPTDA